MKVVFVTQPWDGIGSGSSLGILTCNLINRIPAETDVIIAAKNGRCETPARNIRYIYLNYKIDKLIEKLLKAVEKPGFFNKKSNPHFSSVFYYFFYIFVLSLKLKNEKPDIIHIYNFSQFVPVIRFFNPAAKIILNMHCEWLSQISRKKISKRLENTDLVIGCSNYISRKISERFPEYRDKIITVPNATDPYTARRKRDSQDKTKRILFVGRISPEKGIHTLIEAFNIVENKIPDSRLDLIGSIKTIPLDFIIGMDQNNEVQKLTRFYGKESYFSQLEKMINQTAYSKVKFHNHKNREELEDFYNNADIVVNPSLSESFGMAVIEANSFGVPVIVTKTGGMDELVENGKNGFKVSPSDPEKLADKILLLLENKELNESMGEQGLAFVTANFSWDVISEILLTSYSNLLKAKGNPD